MASDNVSTSIFCFACLCLKRYGKIDHDALYVYFNTNVLTISLLSSLCMVLLAIIEGAGFFQNV